MALLKMPLTTGPTMTCATTGYLPRIREGRPGPVGCGTGTTAGGETEPGDFPGGRLSVRDGAFAGWPYTGALPPTP